jgi:hypothetical protein
MLFEIAVAVGEQLVRGAIPDWDLAVETAVARQRKHFDAGPISEVTDDDKYVAIKVANNLARMLESKREAVNAGVVVVSPVIPGFRWISSSTGDFSVSNELIEVKCVARHFSSADYRQIIIYWLLSYAAALEGRGQEWQAAALVNPRLGLTLNCQFDDLLNVVSGGISKIDLLQMFSAIVEDGIEQ